MIWRLIAWIVFTLVQRRVALAGSGTFRSYTRISETIKEIIDARIYVGIHFRRADVQGSIIGKKVAHWAEKHYFERTD